MSSSVQCRAGERQGPGIRLDGVVYRVVCTISLEEAVTTALDGVA
jgi:hypothetical protein